MGVFFDIYKICLHFLHYFAQICLLFSPQNDLQVSLKKNDPTEQATKSVCILQTIINLFLFAT